MGDAESPPRAESNTLSDRYGAAVCPDRRSQPDDGEALRRFHDRVAAAIGSTVGERIAEARALDHPFARALARATDDVAQPPETVFPSGRGHSYMFAWGHDEPTTVMVWLFDDDDDGNVGALWGHPDDALYEGDRIVQARTEAGRAFVVHSTWDPERAPLPENGFKNVCRVPDDPALNDTARELLAGVKKAWNDYRSDVRAVGGHGARADEWKEYLQTVWWGSLLDDEARAALSGPQTAEAAA